MKGELLILLSLVIACNACSSSKEPEVVNETEKDSKPKPDSSSTNRETHPLETKPGTKPDSKCPNQTLYCKLGNDNTMCKYCG